MYKHGVAKKYIFYKPKKNRENTETKADRGRFISPTLCHVEWNGLSTTTRDGKREGFREKEKRWTFQNWPFEECCYSDRENTVRFSKRAPKLNIWFGSAARTCKH